MKHNARWMLSVAFGVLFYAPFAAQAQFFPPPGFYPSGSCPPPLPGVTVAPFPRPMPVATPAHYFPALPVTAERPALPVAITVWRVDCQSDPSVASLWVRMTPDLSQHKGVAMPKVTVVQGGVEKGWFGVSQGTTLSSGTSPNPAFAWNWVLWPTGYIYASVTDNLQALVPFNPDLPFTFKVRHPTTWPDSSPDLVYEIPARGQPGNVASVPFALAGLWWNPEEPGSGLILDRNERGAVFAGWLTYDDAGASTWFVMSNGTSAGDNVVEGDVYHPTGPAFSDPVFDTTRFSAGTPIGRFRIEFTDADSGWLSYAVNGRTGKQPIQRLVVRKPSGEACTQLRGMWWNQNEAGWGLSLEGGDAGGCDTHASWFTYDEQGKPAWFFAGIPGITATGTVYRPRGSPYGRLYEPGRFGVGAPVGEFKVKVESSYLNEARIFSYRIGSATRSVTVERFRFEY